MAEKLNEVLAEVLDAAERETEGEPGAADAGTEEKDNVSGDTSPEELERLRQQNGELYGLLLDIRREVAEREAAEEGNRELPPLPDEGALAAMSPEERSSALAAYRDALTAYVKEGVLSELTPLLEKCRADASYAEDIAARNTLRQTPGFEDFAAEEKAVEEVLRRLPALSSLPAEEKYTVGYLIRRGVMAINAGKKAEDPAALAERVEAEPEVMKLLEARRLARLEEQRKNLPPLSPSVGQSSAPALSPDTPRNLAEASRKARRILNIG